MKDLIIRIVLALMFVVAFALSSGALVYIVWNGVVDLLVGVPGFWYTSPKRYVLEKSLLKPRKYFIIIL